MNITIVGTGYVGLVTGTCFANAGNSVICLDVDPEKLKTLRKGEAPFYEPGLSELMTSSIDASNLIFSNDPTRAYENADIIFVCVGTPTGDDGRCNLSFVMGVADDIAKALESQDDRGVVVVVKSTVPVGTTHAFAARIRESSSANFSVANNPEFLREGNAVENFMKPDRIVCGVEHEHASNVLTKLYNPFVDQDRPLLFFDICSSEMVKYASNAMLACKISFINEIATLCERNGANIEHVRNGMCADNRIGTEFYKSGIGYGGSCFPKDTLAVMEMGDDLNAPCLVNTAVHEINQRQRRWFADRIVSQFDGSLAGKKIAIWGLAFKPQTDDVRDAPSIDIAKTLSSAGASISAYDPEASDNFQKEFPDVQIAADMYSAIDNADALVICTEWKEFHAPDFEKMKQLMNDTVVFDGRNLYTMECMKDHDFQYFSVGRPDVVSQTMPDVIE